MQNSSFLVSKDMVCIFCFLRHWILKLLSVYWTRKTIYLFFLLIRLASLKEHTFVLGYRRSDVFSKFFLLLIYVLDVCTTSSHLCLEVIVIIVSVRVFTKYNRADYLKWKFENRIVPDGVNAKVVLIIKISRNTFFFKHGIFTNNWLYWCIHTVYSYLQPLTKDVN